MTGGCRACLPVTLDAGGGLDAGEVDEPDGLWVWENPLPNGNSFYGVWGTARDDVWAVGDQGTTLHWDGRRWKRFRAPPPLLFDKTGDLFKVISVAKDDVWAVGERGAFAHWDGTDWRGGDSPTPQLRAIWGGTADDIWAVGEGGAALHRQAGKWSVVATPTGHD